VLVQCAWPARPNMLAGANRMALLAATPVPLSATPAPLRARRSRRAGARLWAVRTGIGTAWTDSQRCGAAARASRGPASRWAQRRRRRWRGPRRSRPAPAALPGRAALAAAPAAPAARAAAAPARWPRAPARRPCCRCPAACSSRPAARPGAAPGACPAPAPQSALRIFTLGLAAICSTYCVLAIHMKQPIFRARPVLPLGGATCRGRHMAWATVCWRALALLRSAGVRMILCPPDPQTQRF